MGVNLTLKLFIIFVSINLYICNIVRLTEIRQKELVTGSNSDFENHDLETYFEEAIYQTKESTKYVTCIINELKKENQKKFVVKSEKLSWYNAWRECEKDGMRFASITSKEDQEVVEAAMKDTTSAINDAWIGGQNSLALNSGSTYVWISSGHALTYSNWNVNYRNSDTQRCVMVQAANFTWVYQECSSVVNSYICEYQ